MGLAAGEKKQQLLLQPASSPQPSVHFPLRFEISPSTANLNPAFLLLLLLLLLLQSVLALLRLLLSLQLLLLLLGCSSSLCREA